MSHARLRLASLWVSQTARVLADWCLRMAVVAGATDEAIRSSWHLATAVFITPFILLAPLNGVLGNGLPRRRVLVGAATYTLLVVAGCTAAQVPWVVCLGAVALGAAVYSPARYAMLPAAAVDAQLPLPRLNGWMEAGGAAAIVLGALLGAATPPDNLAVVLLGLNALCLATALPTAFPSDAIRPEPVARAVAGFFRDCGRIGRTRAARASLLGLATFQAIVTAGSGVLLMIVLDGDGLHALLGPLLLTGGGAALGCATASLQGNPRRCLGLVPLGATGLLAALIVAGLVGGAPAVPCLLLGFAGGLVNVPLRSVYLAAVPADARGNATAAMNTAIYLLTTALALAFVGLDWAGVLATPGRQLAAVAGLAALGTAVAWRVLYAVTIEAIVDVLLVPMYRVRAHGPGADRLPHHGPLLIVANHSAYLDPFWLGKPVPRQIRPMMTSAFYDLPVVRWLSANVARAIRVQEGKFRREAPELQEAIDALRAGECVVVFPEARLRRTEDVLARPFGRGVWHILQAMPDTPVCPCWIEGGWGSYFSYRGGPPMTNKRLDWRRPIDLVFGAARPLDPAILADHRRTRTCLRKIVLDCRRHLGLPTPSPAEEPAATLDLPAAALANCDGALPAVPPLATPASADASEAAAANPHQINP